MGPRSGNGAWRQRQEEEVSKKVYDSTNKLFDVEMSKYLGSGQTVGQLLQNLASSPTGKNAIKG